MNFHSLFDKHHVGNVFSSSVMMEHVRDRKLCSLLPPPRNVSQHLIVCVCGPVAAYHPGAGILVELIKRRGKMKIVIVVDEVSMYMYFH